MLGYISKYCGFCFGVSLAVKAAYEESRNEKLFMYGEVVHNPVVIDDLNKNGVSVVNDLKKITYIKSPKILIRAHGISKSIFESLKRIGAKVIDKTCPKVRYIHKIVSKACSENQKVIIVGNFYHPEVVGISGWCSEPAVIVENFISAESVLRLLRKEHRYCIVAQTTYNREKYLKICNLFKKYLNKIEIHDTICNDSVNRQIEINNISKVVDMVIVVGGKNSSNTNKLVDIAKENCDCVQHIERYDGLNFEFLDSVRKFAIFSGASTPMNEIRLLIKSIENYNKGKNIETEIIFLK